jgi:two-component system, NtrC family, sensor histidine kinase GlrK
MKRYPRSFLQLVTFGHILFALPLLVAAVYVFVTLEALNDQYRAAIEHTSISSRLSGELGEDLLHMERNLRRYEVLQDADTLGDYVQVRGEWQANVEAFIRLPPLPRQMIDELRAQIELERLAYGTLRDTGNAEQLRSVIDEIRLRSEKTLDEARTILNREQEEFLSNSDSLRRRLLLAAVFAALIALVCLWLIRSLLARLIGRFEKALLRLGKGDLKKSIALDGPGDLRWLGRWLEWLRRRLLSLEEERTQVLRHVSHELKTPLAALHEGASLLAEKVSGPLTLEQSRIVTILQSNSRRLQELIDGLLRLQQAGHAAERIGYETLRFDQVIEQVLDTQRLIAGERNIIFDCSLPATEIVAGREALITIVHNLISNAVKFSPENGTIQVTLQPARESAFFHVIDQGPGVAEKDRKQIFEPFFRSQNSREVAGVGLGLAITREFVLAHRGDLRIMPSTNGAHFCVMLPLHAPHLRIEQDV